MKAINIVLGLLAFGLFIIGLFKGSMEYMFYTYIATVFFLVFSEIHIYYVLRKDKNE